MGEVGDDGSWVRLMKMTGGCQWFKMIEYAVKIRASQSEAMRTAQSLTNSQICERKKHTVGQRWFDIGDTTTSVFNARAERRGLTSRVMHTGVRHTRSAKASSLRLTCGEMELWAEMVTDRV